ncbi:MAG: hypothetical protein Fur0020_06760 [Thermodesulfovibrionia bacterium]
MGFKGLRIDSSNPKPLNIAFLLVSTFFLLTFVLQYTFRILDDNRLTSWQWVFIHTEAWKVYLIIVASLLFSYISSRHVIPQLLLAPPKLLLAPPIFEGSGFDNKPIVLFVIGFIAVIPFWQEPEPIVDASRYFTQAKNLEVYGIRYFLKEWGKNISAWTDMPLIPFVYGLIFKFIGEYRTCIQIFNTTIFSLTLVLTYLIGKSLWDEDIGFYGGLLLMGIPYIFTQVPLMLVDIHVMFLLTLSVYTFIKALRNGGIWIAFSSLCISMSFFSKYSIWLMMTILPLIFLFCRLEGSPSSRGFITSLFSALLIAIFFLYNPDVFTSQIKFLLEYQRPGLKRWTEGFTSTFLFQIHPFITAFALYSFYIAIKKRDLRFIIIGYLIVLVILLQIKRIRYIIPVFPMLSLMASYGMQGMDPRLKRFIVLCILSLSLSIAISAYLPFIKDMSMMNLKKAGEFLNRGDMEAVEVITIPSHGSPVNQAVSVPLLDLFTEKRLIYHYKPEDMPSKEDIETSPLRFTWEYKNPRYYEGHGLTVTSPPNVDAMVVISEGDEEGFPEYVKERARRYSDKIVFNTSEGIFQYRTFVTIMIMK